ncbi:MAG: hypothetical protein KKA67_03810 [Spirochaetes bacterium]|nr:hypothetical protein [Spirochaetota bacterium]MBU1079564.1 hypothetical protein [Spirochaetota bacterium]
MAERIGDYLVRIGVMSEESVRAVLDIQDKEEEPRVFGEIAIELGFIDDSALKRYLDEKAASR